MTHAYRHGILTSAIDAGIKEVTEYQVNIDNFRLVIERIYNDAEMKEFKEQIESLLASSRFEQRKAQIMLDVIKSQLE